MNAYVFVYVQVYVYNTVFISIMIFVSIHTIDGKLSVFAREMEEKLHTLFSSFQRFSGIGKIDFFDEDN